MNNKCIKIIHMAPLGTGGITNLTININRQIDRNKIHFDYLVFRNRKEWAEESIYELGSKKVIVDVENVKNPIIRFFKKMLGMRRVFIKENYDVVHVDASTPYDVIVAVAAKLAGIHVIIMHSHNNSYKKDNWLKGALFPLFKAVMLLVCTDYIAISEPAAVFMFPKYILKNNKYTIVKNGINVDAFKFNEEKRLEFRNSLDINSDVFLLGNIGRFVYQKNHYFILNVFKKICELQPNSKLLLVGEGPLKEELMKQACDLDIIDNVIFYGTTNNISSVLNGMDAFIFPSRFEGLGIVAIEAQASGLPVWCAETIPDIVNVTDNYKLITGWDCDDWAKIICDYGASDKRFGFTQEIKDSGFDLAKISLEMQDYYIKKVGIKS